jgi:putative photosynthetic complex assembly protein 2
LLVHQSQKVAHRGFITHSLFTLVAWLCLPLNASITTPIAVASGFLIGLVIWGWLELSYLLGYVNGPNHSVCKAGASTWSRFKGALGTTIYHEAAVIASVALLAAVSVSQPNPTAFYTVAVLCLMRWSAKLNLFFGVRVFNDRWLPNHLHYLTSYLRVGKSSWLLPASAMLGFFVTMQIYSLAGASEVVSYQLSLYLVASLMLLASIEHVFLMFPVNESTLWRWAKQDTNEIRVVRQQK